MDEWGAPLRFGGAKNGRFASNFNSYTPNKLQIKQRESGYVKEVIKLKESYALKSFSIAIVFFSVANTINVSKNQWSKLKRSIIIEEFIFGSDSYKGLYWIYKYMYMYTYNWYIFDMFSCF